MLRTSANRATSVRRTLKAEYPSLPYACRLHPKWDKSVDIFPGTVMGRVEGELVAPIHSTVDGAKVQDVFGLSGLFCAPKYGIDECVGTDYFAVWVGDSTGVFRLLAPAFDDEANWSTEPGKKKLVYAKKDNGLITTTENGKPVGTLIEANLDEGFVRISLDKSAPNTTP